MNAVLRTAAAGTISALLASLPAAAEELEVAALGDPGVQTLLETPVVGEHGEVVGSVTGVIAGGDGSLQYLYLSTGGFLGIGAEEILVPWDRVRYDSKEEFLRVEEKASDRRDTLEIAVE